MPLESGWSNIPPARSRERRGFRVRPERPGASTRQSMSPPARAAASPYSWRPSATPLRKSTLTPRFRKWRSSLLHSMICVRPSVPKAKARSRRRVLSSSVSQGASASARSKSPRQRWRAAHSQIAPQEKRGASSTVSPRKPSTQGVRPPLVRKGVAHVFRRGLRLGSPAIPREAVQRSSEPFQPEGEKKSPAMKEGGVSLCSPMCGWGGQSVQVDPFFETRISHETIHPAAFGREKKVA